MSSHSYDQPGEFPEGRSDKKFRRWLLVVGCLIAGLLIACVFTGCLTQRKAADNIAKYNSRYPGILAKPCADAYPPRILKDSTNTVYVKGDEIPVPGETVYIDVPGKDGKIIKMPCPPNTRRIDTVYKDHYREQESTGTLAALDTMRQALDRVKADRDKAIAKGDRLQKGRNNWRWIGIGGLVLLVAGFILKLKKIV